MKIFHSLFEYSIEWFKRKEERERERERERESGMKALLLLHGNGFYG